MKLRKLTLTWHRYIGLTFGLLLLILGLTGSVLVFQRQIDRFLNPSLMQVASQAERSSIDAVLAVVRQAYPELQLQSITFPELPSFFFCFALANTSFQAWTLHIPVAILALVQNYLPHAFSNLIAMTEHDLYKHILISANRWLSKIAQCLCQFRCLQFLHFLSPI